MNNVALTSGGYPTWRIEIAANVTDVMFNDLYAKSDLDVPPIDGLNLNLTVTLPGTNRMETATGVRPAMLTVGSLARGIGSAEMVSHNAPIGDVGAANWLWMSIKRALINGVKLGLPLNMSCAVTHRAVAAGR